MQEAIRHGGRAAVDRPTREQISPAAAALVERHSLQLIATARRYSLSAEDAEDAFQRGLEILLTRAPSLAENELVPWMKTVVKHEAFSIRKARQRAELAGDPELAGGHVPGTHEQAERLERLRVGVEALGRLKPQEVRCLLLRAEGYSYKQICDETGFSYTKVNRCLTEGRRSFLDRVRGIESGAECARLEPALSRFVDGEASADDLLVLRPHLRSCLACRARLRDYRQVAAFLPLVVAPGLLRRVGRFLSHLGFAKTAAVVAVAGSLVGGGVAVVHRGDAPHHRPAPPAHAAARTRPAIHKKQQLRVKRQHRPIAAHTRRRKAMPAPAPARTPSATPAPTPAPAPTSAPPSTPAPRPAATSGEFGP